MSNASMTLVHPPRRQSDKQKRKAPQPSEPVIDNRGIFGYPSHPEELIDLHDEKSLMRRAKQAATMESGVADQRLQMIAEAIPQIVWTADPDGYQDFFNHRWFEYTGFSPEETYAGKTALHPDDFPIYVEQWSQALASGRTYESEYRFRRADGEYRWHLVRGLPIWNEAKHIVKWLGTFTDIHDKKMAEQRAHQLTEELERRVARRTEQLKITNTELEMEIARRMQIEERDQANIELLRTIIDTMPMGAVVADPQNQILYVNERFSTLFGISDEADWIGRTLTQLARNVSTRTLDPSAFLATLSQFQKEPAPIFDFEIELEAGRTVLMDYFPITIGLQMRGQLFLFRDVTRERRVDVAKSEFMSLASHQLRTPLTSIRWALARLSKSLATVAGASDKHLLEVSRENVQRMAETIGTMLTISRLESDSMHLRISEFGLAELLEDVRQQLQQTYEAKQLKFTILCSDALHINTDAKLLREILHNLITNAVKYTPKKGSVSVRARVVKKAICIEVRDTGIGIPLYQQEKIFSKFFRADNVLQSDTEGTGLGLYLVASLVRLLRGSIGFLSKEKGGTTFTIVLPRKYETPAA